MVGESFAGNQELGGDFKAMATWGPCRLGIESDESQQAPNALTLEKHFGAEGGELVMIEVFQLDGADRLSLKSILRGIMQ